MKIEHISISRESTWQECAKKYFYRYHLGQVPAVEPIYFLYGKIIHKIIEVYTKSHGKENINYITKAVLSGEIELEEGKEGKPGKKAGSLTPEYRAKIPIHLTSFMKLTKSIGLEGDVECKFEYDLDPPHKRLVTGVIDRNIRTPKSCFIIDYKTTKDGPWRKDKTTIKGDLQLMTYAKIAQKDFGYSADQIHCALFFLEGGTIVDTQFTQEQINSVEKRLLDVYKKIETSNPEKVRGTVGKHCYRCDYRLQCPDFNCN